MFLQKKIYAFVFIIMILNGCGGGGSSSSLSSTTYTGYVIDAPVANLTYKCGDKTAKTNTDGRFDCSILPVTFFIGNLEIGNINTINTDTKVFVQDIVKVDRNDFNNTNLLKLAVFLQSLDNNKSDNSTIHIPDNLNLVPVKPFVDMSISDINVLLTTSGITPTSSENAQQHLREFSDIDTLAPKLILNGEANLSILRNSTYKELGAIATDDRDKNITVEITGTIDVNTLGTYYIKYNASDKTGNKAKEVTRTITINPHSPNINNAPALVSTIGIAIPNTIFSNTGGAITSCSITPALPAGLTLTDDCNITGTPTVAQASKTYTLTANNSTGTDTATVSITVNIPKPNINNAPALVSTIGIAIPNTIFSNTGGTITSCSITPALPAGLTLTDDCNITGTPTVTQATKTYTLTANNSTGTDTATVSITVNIPKPNINNAPAIVSTVDIAIPDTIFNNTGGAITSCSITPALPAGLTLTDDCNITGTPTTTPDTATYTVTAQNTSGTDTATVSITITELRTIILLQNAAIDDIEADIDDDEDLSLCTSTPLLPEGVNLEGDCTITGTPTKGQGYILYTLSALTDDFTMYKEEIFITIKVPKPKITNAVAILNTINTPIPNTVFTNTGGNITSCSISPSLPEGLTLSNDCTITGTATKTQTTTNHTVTATNDNGSHTANISITIKAVKTILLLQHLNVNEIPLDTNKVLRLCTSKPLLPDGLNLEDNCTITGTPRTSQSPIVYTIDALTANSSIYTDKISIEISFNPNDELLSDQWYIENNGTAPDTWGAFKNLTKGADMNVTAAWKQGATGKAVVITVVDTGIDFSHPDLINQEKKGYLFDLETASTTEQNLTTTNSSEDHGTSCAGIISAEASNEGVVGIAPHAKLTAHRAVGLPSFKKTLLDSYDKIRTDNISQVSNHSYGRLGISYPGWILGTSTEEYDTIKALVTKSHNGKGHSMFFTSGNYRQNSTDSYGLYSAQSLRQQHPYLMLVSGFNANDQEVSYANAGPTVLVAGATGDRSLKYGYEDSSKKLPSAAIATTGINNIDYTNSITHRDNGTDEPNGYTMGFNGTSASAPMVSGVAALILSANSELTWRDVRWILAATARKIQLDRGVIDQDTGKVAEGKLADKYWSTSGNKTFGRYSHYFGYGAANAGAAVALAKSPDYTLLPTMKECEVTVNTDNNALIPEGCPNTIEFVRVHYTVDASGDTNDLFFTMTLNHDNNKTINLLRPTTCAEDKKYFCDYPTEISFVGGTVGFLGDSIQKDNTFNFKTFTSENKDVTHIRATKVTIMGHDK